MQTDLEKTTLPPHPALHRYYARMEEKKSFVRGIFDENADDYNRMERIMALGSGPWYRRQALMRSGLKAGMRTLDVAVGTGLVSREAITIVGGTGKVLGLDLSFQMLKRAQSDLRMPLVQSMAERLPLATDTFDFLSMGYALRHMEDLDRTFREFWRVLKPGGTVCILEMTRPRRRVADMALRFYVRSMMPAVARLFMGNARVGTLWKYFWDTIQMCVPPEKVMEAMEGAGFVDVRRHIEIGIFSEYTGRKPI
jgi:demethylmenaquinone methyltransferase/2-methoxy-6-polyprenyl-1,4-benzoquinol methylase